MMIIISDKSCKVCGSFERYSGSQHKCVMCHREKNRQRYRDNPNRFKAQVKQYRDANKEKIRKQKKANSRTRQWANDWRLRNADHVRRQQREWCAANIERHMLRRTRAAAKRKGLAFNLELADIVIPKICPLLGIVLERKPGVQADSTPSLDRIDSSLGYVKGNVWVISWRANNLKRDATLEELKRLVAGLEQVHRRWLLKRLVRKVS